MKRKKIIFLISSALIIILSVGGLWHYFSPKKIWLCMFVNLSSSETPLHQMTIEGESYPIEISLSSCGRISLPKEILDKVKDKRPKGTNKSKDIQNNEYDLPVYILPKIEVAGVTFYEAEVEEKNEKFRVNALLPTFKKCDNDKLARIGRRLLTISNLLLDLEQKKIYLTNDEKRLRRSGYFFEDFVKVPLILNGGVRVEINTDLGIRKFAIDTGTAKSFINSFGVPNTNLKEESGLKIFTSSKFAIGNMDFGSQDLYLLDVPIEAKDFEGILGMDFLRSHILYLDYKNKWAYIRNALP
ncbi:MAG: hypothetical protein HZB76_04915 [Chlamydiae bacterium]|nr:hypothetical protein [Chlamydiota bacterium]